MRKPDESKMAGVAGLEPVTSAVTGQRSNQLSYTPAKGRQTLRLLRPAVNSHLPDFGPLASRETEKPSEEKAGTKGQRLYHRAKAAVFLETELRP
jgi:hypothetical protein